MKLAWSAERASKAYIHTVQSRQNFHESGVAEMISAMAAGWNAKLIAETWSEGGVISTSMGLSIARHYTGGRHVCIVPDERSRSEYSSKMMIERGMSPEIMVGEADEVMNDLVGIDFLVVDSRRKDYHRVLRLAKLSNKGAVLLCKNVCSKPDSSSSSFIWRSVLGQGSSHKLVRSVFLPVGKGVEMAHVSATGVNNNLVKGNKRWVKHVDQLSGDVHFIRT